MLTPEDRTQLINRMVQLPDDLSKEVEGLSEEELTTAYVSGEWTVAQNVHHVADAHINAYMRVKLMLTEDTPVLKPYDQNAWAEMVEATGADVGASLDIIRGLHARWVKLLRSIDPADEGTWQTKAYHPEAGELTLDTILRIYGNHGHGHIQQIRDTLAAK